MDGFKLKILQRNPEEVGLKEIKQTYQNQQKKIWLGFISFNYKDHTYHARMQYTDSSGEDFEDFKHQLQRVKNSITSMVVGFNSPKEKGKRVGGPYDKREFYRFVANELKAYSEMQQIKYTGNDFSLKYDENKLNKMLKKHSDVSQLLHEVKSDWLENYGYIKDIEGVK